MLVESNKILVCVLVYDRIKNLNLWLTAWNQCAKLNSKIAVIHNHDGTKDNRDIPPPEYKILCDRHEVDFYCPRRNKGFDIGALQDLNHKRLQNQALNEYDYDFLMWAVDDCLPMNKNFLYHYLDKILQKHDGSSATAEGRARNRCGLVGAQLSKEYADHIRTNAFMIRPSTLNSVKFPANPIRTKLECYALEHRSHNMTKQITDMGMTAEQVDPKNISTFFWDTGHHRQLQLWNRFFNEFPQCKGIKP